MRRATTNQERWTLTTTRHTTRNDTAPGLFFFSYTHQTRKATSINLLSASFSPYDDNDYHQLTTFLHFLLVLTSIWPIPLGIQNRWEKKRDEISSRKEGWKKKSRNRSYFSCSFSSRLWLNDWVDETRDATRKKRKKEPDWHRNRNGNRVAIWCAMRCVRV